jgi:Undecaprenyl-phosphate glucose phosphotransferase
MTKTNSDDTESGHDHDANIDLGSQASLQTDMVAETGNAEDTETTNGVEKNNLNRLARHIADQLSEENYSPAIIRGSFRVFEAFGFMAAGFTPYISMGYFANTSTFMSHASVILAATVLLAVSFFAADVYTTQSLSSGARILPRAIAILSTLFALMAVGGYFIDFQFTFAWNWFSAWFIGAALFISITRILFAVSMSRWNRNGFMERRAVIVGGGPAAKKLIRDLENEPDNDIRICGIFDDRSDDRSPPVVAGYPKLGSVKDVVAFARLTQIDMLILTLPLAAESRWIGMLKHLWVLPVDIRLAAHANSMKFRPRFYSYAQNSKIPMLALFDKPIANWDSVSKRIFDIIVALFAIAILWPLMVATAIAIKVNSKGPVLFKQMRHGINNEEILIFKYRSMYTDMSDEAAANVVTKGDPRVTTVGRFIRKTSIDELPQLFNVLMGTVSLVGPRPHAVIAQSQNKYFADVVDGYFARHRVKPGITGWAQVNGLRGEITSDDKIKKRTEYDLDYIENWSLWFDIKILIKTPISLFNIENAY